MNKSIFKTYLIYFICILTFVGVRIASNLGVFDGISNSLAKTGVATIIIQIFIMLLLPMLLTYLLKKQTPKQQLKNNYFNKLSFKAILISFAIGILLFFLNLIIANFFSSIIYAFGYSSTSSSTSTTSTTSPILLFLFEVVFVAILPAVCEEFLHRGVLMRGVGENSNYKTAIIVSSVCFGLMHLNIEQVFYATILGLIIGFVGAMSDSIFPCMILHFCNNFFSTYFSYASSQGWWGSSLFSTINSIYSNNSPLLTLIFTLFVFAMLIVGICYLIYILFKETRLKKLQKSLLNVQQEISGDIESQSPQKLSLDFQNYILPHLKDNKQPLALFLPQDKDNQKQTLSTNLFLYSTVFMGVMITIFTFIWGVI